MHAASQKLDNDTKDHTISVQALFKDSRGYRITRTAELVPAHGAKTSEELNSHTASVHEDYVWGHQHEVNKVLTRAGNYNGDIDAKNKDVSGYFNETDNPLNAPVGTALYQVTDNNKDIVTTNGDQNHLSVNLSHGARNKDNYVDAATAAAMAE